MLRPPPNHETLRCPMMMMMMMMMMMTMMMTNDDGAVVYIASTLNCGKIGPHRDQP